MKTIKSFFFAMFFIALISSNANAQDDSKKNTQILKNIYNNVVLKNSNNSITAIDELITAIENKKDVKVHFVKFMQEWKSVEAFYILADINEDYIDIPRYIDIFHNGNEDIKEQLNRVIKSSDSLDIELFKNSLKSINALEYILYAKDLNIKRVQDIALKISKTIKAHLEDINSEYKTQEKEFYTNLKKANAAVINALIQNSYKLKEWRVGDVAGLSKKYKGKAKKQRAEYYLSRSSYLAILAILETYEEVLNNANFEDFGDYLTSMTSGVEMNNLKVSLKKSIELTKEIKNDDLSKANELFNEINKVHVILFLEMIEELSINAKILDADGD